jgi:hypothetical protein
MKSLTYQGATIHRSSDALVLSDEEMKSPRRKGWEQKEEVA